MAKLFGRENKNSNFHNFLHDDMNNSVKVLNQIHVEILDFRAFWDEAK